MPSSLAHLHMSPLHAAALKLRTSNSIYSCSSPLRYKKSAKRCAQQKVAGGAICDVCDGGHTIKRNARLLVNFRGVDYRSRSRLEFGAHLDGHVGDCEEIVELDAKCIVQLFLVFGLQCRLSTKGKRRQNKTVTRGTLAWGTKSKPESKCNAHQRISGKWCQATEPHWHVSMMQLTHLFRREESSDRVVHEVKFQV